jgi:hypothetical protein
LRTFPKQLGFEMPLFAKISSLVKRKTRNGEPDIYASISLSLLTVPLLVDFDKSSKLVAWSMISKCCLTAKRQKLGRKAST